MGDRCRVCVTGSSGYIGSWLVRKLLQRGHVVNATLRNKEDNIKAGLLKSFPEAESRLQLMEIDLAKTDANYDAATAGCELVFHLATPMLHITDNTKDVDTTSDTSVLAAKSIVESCIRSGTVRRLVYVASLLAASPMLKDGSGQFGDCIDETCCTPLDVPFSYCEHMEWAYIRSKTTTEKEILSYNNLSGGGGLEVVSVASALVGGDTALAYVPPSFQVIISPLTGKARNLQRLKLLQVVCGCVPLVHVDDLCDALVFCAETQALAGGGRVLCAAGYLSVKEIIGIYREVYGDCLRVREEDLEPEMTDKVQFGSTKLVELGFKYNHDVKGLLQAGVRCAIRLGELPESLNIH